MQYLRAYVHNLQIGTSHSSNNYFRIEQNIEQNRKELLVPFDKVVLIIKKIARYRGQWMYTIYVQIGISHSSNNFFKFVLFGKILCLFHKTASSWRIQTWQSKERLCRTGIQHTNNMQNCIFQKNSKLYFLLSKNQLWV